MPNKLKGKAKAIFEQEKKCVNGTTIRKKQKRLQDR